MLYHRVALLSDVHGNSWALEAILADIQRRHITTILNLGDSVYGSLDPAGAAALLMRHCTHSISGNQDRIVHAPDEATRQSADFHFVTQRLSAEQVDWLRSLPATQQVGRIFCCHGTPTSDETYLLEEVTKHGVFLGSSASITAKIGQIEAEVIVCGHSHVPRTVWLPNGQLVVNPGSVGIPAYDHDQPFLHVMESGSPHARYAVLTQDEAGWQVELIAVPYDWRHAATVARNNGRPDRASWIESGRAII
ncbi:MAG: metallophosphoesterase family protein [Caldilineaceae bacterium]